ncbi:amidohydrolase family protein [Catenulispora rubra]|uniref:amidohydrolase family protein n=1 Tax=Catenulispora rubra TaxID=280293 RepID=UPI001892785A|nr:amidohydrolase family protein [Catenulispora rubra]
MTRTTYSLSRRTVLVGGLAAATAAAGVEAVPAAAAATERAAAAGAELALTHAAVVDPVSGLTRRDTTVLMRGDRIVLTGPSAQVPIPAGATVVDLRGKFVIPGLADMHTHGLAFEQIDPALYVANGVTTVREMAGNALVREWRPKIEAGTLLGPRYTIGSRIIDGFPTIWEPKLLAVLSVADAEQGRQAVRQVVGEGADFVKVYSRVSEPALRGIAAESRAQGIRFAGHCPDQVPMEEAAALGQASFEHLFWTLLGSSSREPEIRTRIQQIRLAQGDYAGWFQDIHPLEMLASGTHSPARAQALYARLAHHRSRQVSTLIMHYGLDHARTLDQNDPRDRYLPAPSKAGLDYALNDMYLKDRAPADDAGWAALFEHRLRLVGEMHRAGVPIMVGTDTGTPGTVPGFSVHDELRLLVEAGLSARAALYAATVEPADFLGTASGRVAAGCVADLAVLDANPLQDITNTTKLSGVVVRGRYVGPDERAQLLADVERAAGSITDSATAAAGCPCHG